VVVLMRDSSSAMPAPAVRDRFAAGPCGAAALPGGYLRRGPRTGRRGRAIRAIARACSGYHGIEAHTVPEPPMSGGPRLTQELAA